jgi:hypothetical protein
MAQRVEVVAAAQSLKGRGMVVAVCDIRLVDGVVHYAAVERFRFLRVLRHDNVIRVSLVLVGAGLPHSAEVSGEVRSPGGVRMSYRFAIAAEADGSLVTDTLRLHTPPGLLRFAASQARAVQASRARVLSERLA